jgi:hypothetical protein
MKHKSVDVTTPTHPRYDGQNLPPRGAVSPGTIPPNSTVPRPLPPIEPAKIVSGASGAGIRSAEGPTRTFELPANVSAKQVQQDSFRYGGGRSAGQLSTKR